MKKRALLFMGLVAAVSVNAQNLPTAENTPEVGDVNVKYYTDLRSSGNGSEAVLWSEDFASGIPTTWTNEAFSGAGAPLVNGGWAYRGPSTVPNNTVGSRGAYNSTRGAIQSPTNSNGFIIFDSDYLDNGGLTNADGTPNTAAGAANAPHVGVLTTTAIDLTGSPYIELNMRSYARQLNDTRFLVAISVDGGLTYTDTAEFLQDLEGNFDSPVNELLTADISASAGNQSNVILQFIFDGSNEGYYFWMIDDIQLIDLPTDELRFYDVPDTDPSTTVDNSAPAHDIGFDGRVRTGNMSLNQAVPITFDSNIYNYGSATQTNVTLEVEVFDASSSLVFNGSSPTVASMVYTDSVDFNSFTTSTTWTPSAAGVYDIVYTLESDNVGGTTGNAAPRDTVVFVVTEGDLLLGNTTSDINGPDFNSFDNSFGTNNASFSDDGGAMLVTIPINNGNSAQDKFILEGIQIRFSSLTVNGGDITVEVYDTAGVSFANGSSQIGVPLISEDFQLTSVSGTLTDFLFTNGDDPSGSGGLVMDEGTYYVVVTLFSNTGNNLIRIANDQTFPDGGQSLFFLPASTTSPNSWFTGFSNTASYNTPWIRTISENIPNISIEENTTNAMTLFPNPTTGNVNITLVQGGTYTIEVVDMVGHVVSSEEVTVNGNQKLNRDYSALTNGVYLINVSGGDFTKTNKLTIK